jgi:hypothetical protein
LGEDSGGLALDGQLEAQASGFFYFGGLFWPFFALGALWYRNCYQSFEIPLNADQVFQG